MFMLRHAAWTVLLTAIVLSPVLAAGGDEGPLSMRDIGRLRHQRTPLDEIVEKASRQGVSFVVTQANEKQLSRLGFTPEQIDVIRQAPAVRPKAEGRPELLPEDLPRHRQAPAPGAAAEGGAAGNAPAVVPGQGLGSGGEERDRVLGQITQIVKLSAADLQPAASAHVTLWAAKDDRAAYLPDILQIERHLEDKWPELLRSGLDKRAAHLVLLKTRYDYQRWVRAMFDIMPETYKLSGAPDGTADMKASILKWTGYYSHHFVAICMEGQGDPWLHRMASAAVGFMNFTQQVEPQRHDPLSTGFANHVESLLAGSPRVMLFSNSYHNEDRDLGKDPRAWLHLVQARMRAKQESGLRQLLGMDTTNMLLPQYAEAWTLAAVLVKQPEKFARLLLALREEKDPLAAIEQVYGWDEKTLEIQWHKQVLGQR